MNDRAVPAELAESRLEADRDVQQVAVADRVLDRARVAERPDVRRELDHRLAEREVDAQALDRRLARRHHLELAPAHALPDRDRVLLGDGAPAVDVARLDLADADDVGAELERLLLQVPRGLGGRGERAGAGGDRRRRSAGTGHRRSSAASRSTSSMRIERPPTAAYQSSQAKAGGDVNSQLPMTNFQPLPTTNSQPLATPNSQRPSGSCGQLRQDRGVAVLCDVTRAIAITRRVGGRQCPEAVHIAVEHAEGGGDEHRVVDLDVGRAFRSRPIDVGLSHITPVPLYASRDRQQRFHLRRDGRSERVADDGSDGRAVVAEMTGRNGGVAVMTEVTVVEG